MDAAGAGRTPPAVDAGSTWPVPRRGRRRKDARAAERAGFPRPPSACAVRPVGRRECPAQQLRDFFLEIHQGLRARRARPVNSPHFAAARHRLRCDEYNDENGLVAGLHAKGVAAGELVAVVGASQFGAAWARVARVPIVAETTDSLSFADYWRASDSTRSTVLRAFAQAGARAVVIWPLDTGHADCGPKPRPIVELLSFSSSDRSPVVPNDGTPK